jgi:2-polyprenyl-6-methoxyphenol hydroxylase-like FAD-dependent oxidoreductase
MNDHPDYDAVVVGARCAGAPTAMLLARAGHRVLLVDRATFPSDTASTLLIHPQGVAALDRWGVLDAVTASGCPPIGQYALDFGPLRIAGRPHAVDGHPAYAPRRIVLDDVLVQAAVAAGADLMESFTVEDLIVEGGVVAGIRGRHDGRDVSLRAHFVIGADGSNSRIARLVDAPRYNEKTPLQCSYYTYWRDVEGVDGMQTIIRPDRGFAAIPTSDDLTLVIVGWPIAEAAAYKSDVEANYLATLEMAPEFADRIRGATRVDRFTGGEVRNFFRTPYGPGWTLVGDAGYTKDPITAQGISDAFRDAEAMSTAIDDVLSGGTSFDRALHEYQTARDSHALPIYEFTTQMATLAPPPPELQHVLGAIAGNQEAMDGFVSVLSGAVTAPEFFAPDNLARFLAPAGT